jgi:hypothetical protein
MADRIVVFHDDGDEGRLEIHGYDDDFSAWIALLIHLRSRFRTTGQEVALFALDEAGEPPVNEA